MIVFELMDNGGKEDGRKKPGAGGEGKRSGFKNFIEVEIDKDLAEGVYSHVQTRFPPEPNGYLHIGHAKSILLNYGLAKKYQGKFNLRFDDTNPTKEKTEFVESIIEDVKWLGADFEDRLFFASNYFEQMYECAVFLIKREKPLSVTYRQRKSANTAAILTVRVRKVLTATVRWKKT